MANKKEMREAGWIFPDKKKKNSHLVIENHIKSNNYHRTFTRYMGKKCMDDLYLDHHYYIQCMGKKCTDGASVAIYTDNEIVYCCHLCFTEDKLYNLIAEKYICRI